MILRTLVFVPVVVTLLGACSNVSSSSAPPVSVSEQVSGPIFITQKPLPSGVQYKVIGVVKANARAGYDSAESLYPLLAQEARKIGANAVVEAYGGRTVSAFSWAAPFVGGTAVRVKDSSLLKSVEGSFVD